VGVVVDSITKNHINTIKKCLKKNVIDKRKAKDALAIEIAMAHVYELIVSEQLTQKQLFKALGIKK